MKAFSAGLFLLCVVSAVGSAQRQEFDVATVKVPPPVPLGAPLSINLGTYRNGTLTLNNVTLSECLQFAYGLVSEEQVSGPDWIKSRDVRFEIVARTTPDVELDRVRPLLQALLADRLKVVAHRAPRPFSFLALVPANGGPKLVAADETQVAPAPNSFVQGRIVGPRVPMQVLALLLSRFERQLVLDRTGLSGRYQLKLEYTPDDRAAGGGDLAARPSLSAALQEQLGLRLESRREPLDVVVVDRAERVPVDN
jgi:uncharacterized protein (TIGR03435 family)